MLVCRLPFRPTLFSLAIILIAVLSSGTMGCVKLPALRLASSIAPAQRAAFTHATDPQGVRSFESPVATDSPDLSPLLVVISYGSGCSADGPGNGLRDLAEAVRSRFPSTLVQVITRTCEQTNDAIELKVQNHRGPVVLIGHSYGGWRSVDIAAHVSRSIDFMILLDPVPRNDWMVRQPGRYFRLPASVRNGVCYYRTEGGWPNSYPITNPKYRTDNRPRNLTHNDFCQSPEIRRYVLAACEVARPLPTGGTEYASN